MATRAVVFDLQGVLVDGGEVEARVFVDVVRRRGVEVTREDARAAMVGRTAIQVLERLLGRPCRPTDLALLHRRASLALREIPLFPGVANLLLRLRRDGRVLGVLAPLSPRETATVLRARHLDLTFGSILCGQAQGGSQPTPYTLLASCRSLGVAPESVVYVASADRDPACVGSTGIRIAHAGWGGGDVEALAADERSVARVPAAVLAMVAGADAPV